MRGPRECQDPRPKWMVEAGGREFCGAVEGDAIHGSPDDCEPQPCINPEAHHDFVPSREQGVDANGH